MCFNEENKNQFKEPAPNLCVLDSLLNIWNWKSQWAYMPLDYTKFSMRSFGEMMMICFSYLVLIGGNEILITISHFPFWISYWIHHVNLSVCLTSGMDKQGPISL